MDNKHKNVTSYIQKLENNLKSKGYPLYDEILTSKKDFDISQFKPINFNDLSKILDITIKEDKNNKIIVFLCALSIYTDNSQYNIIFNAPSSTGKSFIPIEIAKLFPEEDIMEIGYCSPTSFFHDFGEWDDIKKISTINLSGKLIIFLDQPHNTLLERLRPILSHDKKEINIKITDKSDKKGLRTKNIMIIGFPAVIFCTAGLNVDEQESTRMFLLSPEITQDKLQQTIHNRILKETDYILYTENLGKNKDREILKKRVCTIKNEGIKDIKIVNSEYVESLFLSDKAILKPRHQRDINRFLALIKMSALLNVWYRERQGDIIVATKEDIDNAYEIWKDLSKTQEYNIPPYVYNFFEEVIRPLYLEKNESTDEYIGLSKQEILKHARKLGKNIGDWKFRTQIMPALDTAGLVIEEEDHNDKRKKLYYPQIYSEHRVGVNNKSDENVSELEKNIKEFF